MTATEIYEQLKRNVRDDLFRVHGLCPQCEMEQSSSTCTGCPVVDEYMVERIINTCNAGLRAMTGAALDEDAKAIREHRCPRCGAVKRDGEMRICCM